MALVTMSDKQRRVAERITEILKHYDGLTMKWQFDTLGMSFDIHTEGGDVFTVQTVRECEIYVCAYQAGQRSNG